MVLNLINALGTDACLGAIAAHSDHIRKNRKGPFKFQACVYSYLRNNVDMECAPLWHRRLCVVCADYDLQVVPAMQCLTVNLQELCRSNRILVVKTLANSWSTSSRYHEHHRLSCVFGCAVNCPRHSCNDAADSVRHYLSCPILWSIIGLVTKAFFGSSPCSRLGIVAVPTDLRPLALSYLLYHRMNLEHTYLVTNMSSRKCWATVLHLTFEAASAYAAEIY